MAIEMGMQVVNDTLRDNYIRPDESTKAQSKVKELGRYTFIDKVKVRVADMNTYLDADSLRRQANTVVRLTVVTIFGLIGTVTTGFLGMNLLAEADAPMSRRLWIIGTTLMVTITVTTYTMAKSKRLSDFLDALSDERLPMWDKAKSFAAVWLKRSD